MEEGSSADGHSGQGQGEGGEGTTGEMWTGEGRLGGAEGGRRRALQGLPVSVRAGDCSAHTKTNSGVETPSLRLFLGPWCRQTPPTCPQGRHLLGLSQAPPCLRSCSCARGFQGTDVGAVPRWHAGSWNLSLTPRESPLEIVLLSVYSQASR